MSSWHSPQSIFHVGHRAAKPLFEQPVLIQEKVDGSFFAFGYYPGEEPELKIRSKGAMMYVEAPERMFTEGAATVRRLYEAGLLRPGWMYRGEYLKKPKHNALAYDRIPVGHIVLFDILTDEETYLPYGALALEAERVGLEVVPLLAYARIETAEQLRRFLDTTSVLGGQKIEGVVIKPVQPIYGVDKKLLMAKFVSEAYKEVHALSWGAGNPTSGDILTRLAAAYGTQARWQKAVQHLRERGLIEDSPRDIGKILAEVWPDIASEESDAIKEALWKWAAPHLRRMVTRGMPEWYKEQLLKLAFERECA